MESEESAMPDAACWELTEKVIAETGGGDEEFALIRQAQAGDAAAFEALVRAYDRNVLSVILRMVGSAEVAHDLYQEAFLKVFRSLPRFRFQSSFSTWLYRVVMNVCLDQMRRQSSRGEAPPPGENAGPDYFENVRESRATLDPERTLEAREIGDRLEQALATLNPRERAVFELRHYEGLKLRTIGEICGTTEDTAKNCLFRATQKLRQALSDLV
jgi:RNA polymerase sigma-70 factor (ECF subfamily)